MFFLIAVKNAAKPNYIKGRLTPFYLRNQQKTSPILRKHRRGLLLLNKGGGQSKV